MEKSAKVLHYFGLDCGMLESSKKIFYSRAVIVDSLAFLEIGLAKKIAVCSHTTILPKK
jgi:hypothetical protein